MPRLLSTSRLLMLTAWFALVALFFPVPFYAAHGAIPPDPNGPSFLGTRIEFLLLTLVLPGVAIFNYQPFYAAAAGLMVISDCKLFFDLSSAFAHRLWGDLPLFDQLIHKHLGLASDQLAGACRTCPGEPGGTRQDAGESPFGNCFCNIIKILKSRRTISRCHSNISRPTMG
jgi:hypothetical protein